MHGFITEMQALPDSIPREKLLEEIEPLRPAMEERARWMRELPQVEEALTYSHTLGVAMTGAGASTESMQARCRAATG